MKEEGRAGRGKRADLETPARERRPVACHGTAILSCPQPRGLIGQGVWLARDERASSKHLVDRLFVRSRRAYVVLVWPMSAAPEPFYARFPTIWLTRGSSRPFSCRNRPRGRQLTRVVSLPNCSGGARRRTLSMYTRNSPPPYPVHTGRALTRTSSRIAPARSRDRRIDWATTGPRFGDTPTVPTVTIRELPHRSRNAQTQQPPRRLQTRGDA